MTKDNKIVVWGARAHNLKNIDVAIPRRSLTVITGLSGAGKSSLAFDTLFAEGQRRYVETFSAYARNFLTHIARPDVDKITGLSPVISIDQKTINRNPRSTVGTQTELYDFLRLLFARVGEAYSYATGEKMVKYTEARVVDMILTRYAGRLIHLLAPQVRYRRGHYRELFEALRKKGFIYVRIDGTLQELTQGMKVDRYRPHDIEVVVDRLTPSAKDKERLTTSVRLALRHGDGLLMVLDSAEGSARYYSKHLMCPTTGIAYADPAPHNFSFNSPHGACPHCKGLGVVSDIDMKLIMPDTTATIYDGGITPLGKYKNQMIFWQLDALLEKYGCSLRTPLRDIPAAALTEVLNGSFDKVRIPKDVCKASSDYFTRFEGIIKYLRMVMERDESAAGRRWAEQFMQEVPCPACGGRRLNREALHFKVAGKNIAEVSALDIGALRLWVEDVERHLTTQQQTIAREILKELRSRIDFLLQVGLDYLSISRPSATLSGGESQRIRLATQLGSRLVNVLYILDEPSIGLHARDNSRLIASLQALRDIGNTVIVVEHDEETMRAADYIIDIGPRAGAGGGEVLFQGSPRAMLAAATLTSRYLRGEMAIAVPPRRTGACHCLTLTGCTGNNLKNITVTLPLGRLIVITGVSGSGKSTLINGTLQPILAQHFYRALRKPLPYASLSGIEHIDKVISVDQSPIGRTPRSNAATYTGVFADIRALFLALPAAQIRGYTAGRFSFNVRGGRCETCGGNGYKTIEMHFMSNVTVPCEVCGGRRYNRETLEVRYRGKSIADVLNMTIDEALTFFDSIPHIVRKIKTLHEVGLGYITLGQPCTTLSGGESQRVKLATELAKRDTGKTLYVLDEPTTGLHFEDIRTLMTVVQKLVDKGNTVIIIEHNLDVIKLADYVIDLGPDGGQKGGEIVFAGTPEALAASGKGYTATYLRTKLLEAKK